MNAPKTLILGSLLFFSVSTFAQEPASAKSKSEEEKGQQAWMEYMAPGEMHKLLASADGDWSEEVTFWMKPGGPPSMFKSECSNKMILGGRFQESLHSGDMMGMPFEGKGICGYDNIKKVFQSSWVDNMGTGVMFLEGPYDAKTRTITLTGKMTDAMSGKIVSVREVMKFVDETHQVMEMYMTNNGKESKTMEIKFTKK